MPPVSTQYTDADGILHFTTNATRLLGETEERLKAELLNGYNRRDAAKNACVWWEDFRRWMERGGEGHPQSYSNCPPDIHWEPYYSFAKRVAEAERIGKAKPRVRKSGLKPTMLNELQQATVLTALRRGRSFATAARWAGVKYSTLSSILRHGGYPNLFGHKMPPHPEDVSEPYITFVNEVLRAEDSYFTDEPEAASDRDSTSTVEHP